MHLVHVVGVPCSSMEMGWLRWPSVVDYSNAGVWLLPGGSDGYSVKRWQIEGMAKDVVTVLGGQCEGHWGNVLWTRLLVENLKSWGSSGWWWLSGESDVHPRMWWLCWRNGVWLELRQPWLITREHLMIYRRPSFLVVVWFGSSPMPSPPLSLQQVVNFSQSSCVSLPRKPGNL